jgi:hypothetical protein
MGRKPVAGLFSVGVEEPYRWKDSVQAGPEVRIWALDGIANGFRPWFAKFSAVLYDRRWLKTVEDLYSWHHRNERYLRNEAPIARVAIVYSEQTRDFYGKDEAEAKVDDHVKGMYQALLEARVPFTTLSSSRTTSTGSSSSPCPTWPRCPTRSAGASPSTSPAAEA